MSEALKDGIIPLGRWYPFGKRFAYPFEVASGKPEIVRYAVQEGAGGASIGCCGKNEFVAMVRDGIRKEIPRLQRMLDAAVRYGYGADMVERCEAELAGIKGLNAANVPLPPVAFEMRLSADVVVSPKDAAAGDLWGYIDSLTGGCCNTKFNSPTGEVFYEGTWGADEIDGLLADEYLRPVAVGLRVSPECHFLFSGKLNGLLDSFESYQSWQQNLSEIRGAWMTPRLEKMLARINASKAPEGIALRPVSVAHNSYPDYGKNQIRVSGTYQEDGNDWIVEFTGSFCREGDLISVVGMDTIRMKEIPLLPSSDSFSPQQEVLASQVATAKPKSASLGM